MDRLPGLDRLLDDVYRSVVDPEAAARLPFALASALNAGSASLWTFDAATGRPVSDMLTTAPVEFVRLYEAYYHRIDPWRGPGLELAAERPVQGRALVPDAELDRDAYYNEFGRHIDTFHLLGAALRLDPLTPDIRIGFTVHRPRRMATFENGEDLAMAALIPHIRRAVQLRLAIGGSGRAAAAQAASALLEAIPVPAMLTDAAGRVLHANNLAEGADRAGRLRLKAPDGLLAAGTPKQEAALRLLIAHAGMGEAGGTVRIGPGAFAVVAPVPAGLGAPAGLDPGCVLVLVRAISRASPGWVEAAQAVFGLPRAEAESACAVAAGDSPEQVARARGVRLSTVRTQLQRALRRTGAANLRELAALLAAAG